MVHRLVTKTLFAGLSDRDFSGDGTSGAGLLVRVIPQIYKGLRYERISHAKLNRFVWGAFVRVSLEMFRSFFAPECLYCV